MDRYGYSLDIGQSLESEKKEKEKEDVKIKPVDFDAAKKVSEENKEEPEKPEEEKLEEPSHEEQKEEPKPLDPGEEEVNEILDESFKENMPSGDKKKSLLGKLKIPIAIIILLLVGFFAFKLFFSSPTSAMITQEIVPIDIEDSYFEETPSEILEIIDDSVEKPEIKKQQEKIEPELETEKQEKKLLDLLIKGLN